VLGSTTVLLYLYTPEIYPTRVRAAVSIMKRETAPATTHSPQNIQKTDRSPPLDTNSAITSGPADEPIRSHAVAMPVPTASSRKSLREVSRRIVDFRPQERSAIQEEHDGGSHD
jgi:hypothetical protein